MEATYNLICLDVGETRIGLAMADSVAKLPRPLKTLHNKSDIFDDIVRIVEMHNVKILVIGLPRGLDGQDTDQTKYVKNFFNKLSKRLKIPIYLEDEALSTFRVKEDLKRSKKNFVKEDLDALSACFILDDFIANNMEKVSEKK